MRHFTMQNDDGIYSSEPWPSHRFASRACSSSPKAAISAAPANPIVITPTPSTDEWARSGVDGFELALQLQRLVLPSSPPDDQHDAGRADEQHETLRENR